MSGALSTAELLEAGEGPHQAEADAFVHQGGCDCCGSSMTVADQLAGDDLCSRCRLWITLGEWVLEATRQV